MISFRRVALPEDFEAIARFLCGDVWPFHAKPNLTTADVQGMEFLTSETESHWVVLDDVPVGLVRLLDLGDIDDGSPRFGLRIASGHRGQGLGGAAARWLTTYLFEQWPSLHRVEATTRVDNAAMRRVLERCGFQLEGQLREDWRSADGTRFDTMIYGLLRSEWASAPRSA